MGESSLGDDKISQGPYISKPDFDPPRIPGWAWQETNWPSAQRYMGWGQVSDGTWYAFYCNVGPGVPTHPTVAWNREHPDDPNWWYNDDWHDRNGRLVCRHGAVPGQCPDGSCGPHPAPPGPPVTDEEVLAAQMRAIRLVKEMEKDFG